MDRVDVRLRFAAELRFLLPARRRRAEVAVAHDGTSTLGHLVESAGVPLPEVGRLDVGGRTVGPAYRPHPGEAVEVSAVERPQQVPYTPLRFLLDVHLGTLARRLRLLGVDTAYHNDRDDDALVAEANADRRVLLTQDRGLLHRRSLRAGAYVRGSRPDDQIRDVIERFAPPLAPWTRCTACNGPVVAVGKDAIADRLEPGTRARYDTFKICRSCGRLYWPGAHHERLAGIVAEAREIASAAAPTDPAARPRAADRR
ncbi:Mut7-C RNAse domain-containing protein [Nocardiopsis mangrovi]|uniref:Mut7-C RNAse domain-containing protein n=1 Tax=Nocardiopsis mangrovi TaxID=1179818 RepID=A0ABV9E1S9_9ACTN